jgi:hypothetical protein
MNLETILSDTYYIQIHKLTTIEYLNTIITNWHRTLKCPAQDLSPESANLDLPSCDMSQYNGTVCQLFMDFKKAHDSVRRKYYMVFSLSLEYPGN